MTGGTPLHWAVARGGACQVISILIITWVLVLNIDIDIDIDIDIVRSDINNQVEVLLKQVKQESLNIRDAQG